MIARNADKYFPTDHPYGDPRWSIYYLLVEGCGKNSGLCTTQFELQVSAMGAGGPDPAGNEGAFAFLFLSALSEFSVGAGGRWKLKSGPKPVPTKPCNCFPAGTTVATDRGAKPIEQIAVGDQVWARDLATGQSQLRSVVGLFDKRADQILTVTTSGTSLQVTPQHPFWVVGKGWTDAGELRVGDRLSTLAGAEQAIISITSSLTATTVYNFEVAGDHNYYITDAQLLGHNCNLTYHESPERGHTLERHVGKDDAYLKGRIDKSRASSFVDQKTAEKYTQDSLNFNKDKIDAWLKTSGKERTVGCKFSDDGDSKVGRVYVRKDDAFVSPKRVVTSLIRDPNMADGYYIKTSFLD